MYVLKSIKEGKNTYLFSVRKDRVNFITFKSRAMTFRTRDEAYKLSRTLLKYNIKTQIESEKILGTSTKDFDTYYIHNLTADPVLKLYKNNEV